MAILNTVAQFGRYILRSRIADASACEVWIAEIDGAAPGTPSIIFKKLRSELAQNGTLLEAFTQRARRASLLNHESIAKVLDVVQNRGDCGFAVEYLDGKSLRQLIRAVGGAGNALPVWFAIHVARSICQALEHAHQLPDEKGRPQQVTHGALNPENVFLTFLGQVKVTDFGTSRASLLGNSNREPAASTQVPHEPTNTPVPESVGADLAAVGRVLYELLTGICPPTPADRGGTFLPPSHYAPWVNVEVDQLLSRILSPKDPKRLGSAGEIRKALDEYLSVRRHDVTATHIAGLVSVLFSAECRESAPPTARIHQNAVELAILRSRRTNPPDFPTLEDPTQSGFKHPTCSTPPNSQMTRQTLRSPGETPIVPEESRTGSNPFAAFAADRTSAQKHLPERQADRPSENLEAADSRASPFHHDWDLALKRVREELQATQRGSGAFPTAAGATRADAPMDPIERAVIEFERGLEHMRRGEFEAALNAWERALEFDPQHRVCRANLNLLKKKLGSVP